MTATRTVLAPAWLTGAGAGCAGQQPDATTMPSSPARPSLLGTMWTAFEIDGRSLNAAEPRRRPSIMLAADGNRVAGSTGCNRISGTFMQQGSTLRFGMLAMTRMVGAPDRGAAERAFVAAIEATRAQAIENQTLELHDEAGAVRMRLRAS